MYIPGNEVLGEGCGVSGGGGGSCRGSVSVKLVILKG